MKHAKSSRLGPSAMIVKVEIDDHAPQRRTRLAQVLPEGLGAFRSFLIGFVWKP